MPESKPVVMTFPDVETFLIMSGVFKVGCEIVVPTKGPKEFFRYIAEANKRIDADGEGRRYREVVRLMADTCREALVNHAER
jgi:hypothetical protein